MGEFKAYDRASDYRPFYLALSLGARALYLLAYIRVFHITSCFKSRSELSYFLTKIGQFFYPKTAFLNR
jgi:hypothetical protein